MRILHVVGGLQKASGVTTFIENVVEELRALGHEVDILTRESDSAFGFSDYDVVHIHGLWDPWFHKVAKKVPRGRLAWSPHGMLQKWALKNKWPKKLAALALYQWWDLRKADLLHVTAESEVEDVRRLGLKNRLVVAPLGVRVGRVEVENREIENKKTLLFVSRVQRKKGLPNLLEAWSKLPRELTQGWIVRIVGPDQDNHTAELKAQCQKLGLQNVEFVGPKYDAELDAEYEAADLFVLPTHSENFGSVVIEALAHKLPVICTKAAPWEELETHRCGWWIDDRVDSLTDCLRVALTTPSEVLRAMGAEGRKLVEAKYTWRAVASRLSTAYAEIVGQMAPIGAKHE